MGRHFLDDIFKCIFLGENVLTSIKISLKFVPKGPIENVLTLLQMMDWCRQGDKPFSEPMIVCLVTHMYGIGLNDLIHKNKLYRNGRAIGEFWHYYREKSARLCDSIDIHKYSEKWINALWNNKAQMSFAMWWYG